jgi:hypothetical protein
VETIHSEWPLASIKILFRRAKNLLTGNRYLIEEAKDAWKEI